MNWLKKHSASKPSQFHLPFNNINLNDMYDGNQKLPDYDGQYHCAYCNVIIPQDQLEFISVIQEPTGGHVDPQFLIPNTGQPPIQPKVIKKIVRNWTDSNLKGEQLKQDVLNSPYRMADLENEYNNEVNEYVKALTEFRNNQPDVMKELQNIKINNNVYEYEHYLDNFYSTLPQNAFFTTWFKIIMKEILHSPDSLSLFDPNIVYRKLQDNKTKQWVLSGFKSTTMPHLITKLKPICDECEIEYVEKCHSCEKTLLPDDQDNYDINGLHFCGDCVGTCDGCNEVIISEDLHYCNKDGNSYCDSCYEDATAYNRESHWEHFYQNYPHLVHLDVLNKAEDQVPQDPRIYIEIFKGMNWNSVYGGEPWANIAKCWQVLANIRESGNFKDATMWIDHCFDLVHNNGSLFKKAPDNIQSWLFKALEEKKNYPPEIWLNKLSPEIRKLFFDYHKFNPETYESLGKTIFDSKRIAKEKDINQIIEKINNLSKFSNDIQFDIIRQKCIDKDISTNDFIGKIKYPILVELILNNQVPDFPMISLIDLTQEDNQGYKSASYCNFVLDLEPELFSKIVGQDNFSKVIELLSDIVDENVISSSEKRVVNIPENQKRLQEWNELVRATRRNRQPKEQLEQSNQLQTAGIKRLFEKYAYIHKCLNLMSSRFIRLAELNPQKFFDFYALTLIECGKFKDDNVSVCKYFKNKIISELLDDLLPIISRAVIREARHVSNSEAFGDDD